MSTCIIFGCGEFGTATYEKYKNILEFVAWSDNNSSLWGKTKLGLPIISPEEIRKYQDNANINVLVSMKNTLDVSEQLKEMGIHNVFVWKRGLFYSYEGLLPLNIPMKQYKCVREKDELHVLFVSETAYIRDHKMANIINKAGHKAYLAYLIHSPVEKMKEYASIYEEIFPITSLSGLYEFVESSDFDIVHSSSIPDFLTPIMINSQKPVIHDCHDLRSLYHSMTPNQLCIERLAHKYSNGVIYPTSGLRDKAVAMYDIPREKTLVIENYISEDYISRERQKKISDSDHKIHCVYEGGVSIDKSNHKYFFDIWPRLVGGNIHIHFYSQEVKSVCEALSSIHPNIHYEGNMSSKQLSLELTKYDVGLCVFNTNTNIRNKLYDETASWNKVYEYVNCGLPIAVGNIKPLIDLIESNGFGKKLDINYDIEKQLKEIMSIEISKNILGKQGFIFEDYTDELIIFYKKCINKKVMRL